MVTTLELTDSEISDLRELTKQQDTAGALRTALHEFVRYARRMQLKELSGQVTMDDNWRELEAAELNAGSPT